MGSDIPASDATKERVDKRNKLTLEVLEIIEFIALVGYLYFVVFEKKYALTLIAPKTLLFEASLA